MNSRVQPNKPDDSTSAVDLARHVVAIALVIAGVAAFYWFAGQWVTSLRVAAVIGGLLAGGIVFMTSAKGAQTREFLGEARFELRKVVWPTRQEAMRTTWVVVVVVIIMSLILASFDMVIQWLVKLFLGQ